MLSSGLKTKTVRTYGLEVKGEFTSFRTKKFAIDTGKSIYKIDKSVRLIEKYTLWCLSLKGNIIIDEQEFDRTILIK